MRLFIAIEISEELKAEIERLHRPLHKISPYAISYARPNQCHITVKFLGEVPESQLEQVVQSMNLMASRATPFNFKLGNLAYFPNHGPLRIIWLTPIDEDPQGSFDMCREVSDEALKGILEWDDSVPYVPHITVARVQRDNKYQQLLKEKVPLIECEPLVQQVSSFSLFKSTLTVRGAEHDLICSVPFGGGKTSLAKH